MYEEGPIRLPIKGLAEKACFTSMPRSHEFVTTYMMATMIHTTHALMQDMPSTFSIMHVRAGCIYKCSLYFQIIGIISSV